MNLWNNNFLNDSVHELVVQKWEKNQKWEKSGNQFIRLILLWPCSNAEIRTYFITPYTISKQTPIYPRPTQVKGKMTSRSVRKRGLQGMDEVFREIKSISWHCFFKRKQSYQNSCCWKKCIAMSKEISYRSQYVENIKICGGSLVLHQTSGAEVSGSKQASPTMIHDALQDNCVIK